MRRPPRAGVGVIAVYVIVFVATVSISSRHVRPLFEGIGPSAPYQWVKPPPLFAPGNVAPKVTTLDVAFDQMDKPFQVGTSDGQFMINVPARGLAPRAGVAAAHVVLTPADPATLGPLPAGLRPSGNAYRAEFTYGPGGDDATPLAAAGNVTLVVPEPVKTIAYSPDAKTWQSVPAQTLANTTTVGTTFTRSGWYVGAADAATQPPGALAATPAKSKQISTALVALLVVVITALLVGVPAALRRRTRSRSAADAQRRGPVPKGPTGRRRR